MIHNFINFIMGRTNVVSPEDQGQNPYTDIQPSSNNTIKIQPDANFEHQNPYPVESMEKTDNVYAGTLKE